MASWLLCILTGCPTDNFFIDSSAQLGLHIVEEAQEPFPAPEPYINLVIESLFTENFSQAQPRDASASLKDFHASSAPSSSVLRKKIP